MFNCFSFYVCSFSQTISEWNYQFWFTVIQEDEKKKSDGGAGEGGAGEDPPKKKYEQMPKWQKWSYIISVIMMGGLTIANGVLFCKLNRTPSSFKEVIELVLIMKRFHWPKNTSVCSTLLSCRISTQIL